MNTRKPEYSSSAGGYSSSSQQGGYSSSVGQTVSGAGGYSSHGGHQHVTYSSHNPSSLFYQSAYPTYHSYQYHTPHDEQRYADAPCCNIL